MIQLQQPRHVGGMQDLDGQIPAILRTGHRLRALARTPRLLEGKTIILLFEKPSTRTRISFEVGVRRLGGIAVTMDAATSQLGRGESLEDTAQVLSRYGDCIVYRAASHAHFTEFAHYATVPVINALTDREHPCQILADWMALDAAAGLQGRRLAYVGDGNNLCHSYLLGAPMVGLDIEVATPPDFAPNPDIVAAAQHLAKRHGTLVRCGHDPAAAVRGAHAVVTDTWISMGDEDEARARLDAF
ncbi:MAG: ornithine carbamoyltransferase, partial [Thermoplasmatota archaeon]